MPAESPYSTVFSRWKERLEREEHDEEVHDAEAEAHVDAPPAPLAPFDVLKRVPLAVWAFLGLSAGLILGAFVPQLSFLGEGVRTAFGYISDAAPIIIFFTITPALITMYRTSSAGRFALYVIAGFTVSTVLAGLFALLITMLFFPSIGLGFGSEGLGEALSSILSETANLVFTAEPFRAIWGALFVSALLYFGGHLAGSPPRNAIRRMFRTIADIYEIIGVHGVAALGRVIKVIMPFALFAIGVFIVDTAPVGAVEGYFVSVGVLVVITMLWLVIVAVALTQYIKFPIGRLFRDYMAVVYPFAWATSSSSASIPLNMEAARKGLGIRPQIRSFVLPLGATVNLDGTMMAAVVATVVAAKTVGFTPSLLDLLVALIPLLFITIGTPGIPGGLAIVSAPIMATLLPLPAESIVDFQVIYVALLFGLNDMFRTAVNTLDNGFLALLLDKWWPERFEKGAEVNPFIRVPQEAFDAEGATHVGRLADEGPVS